MCLDQCKRLKTRINIPLQPLFLDKNSQSNSISPFNPSPQSREQPTATMSQVLGVSGLAIRRLPSSAGWFDVHSEAVPPPGVIALTLPFEPTTSPPTDPHQ
jgi:hypothetical protein